MAYLQSYVQLTTGGAGAEEVMGAAGNLTFPAGTRGTIRFAYGFFMGVGNCVMRLRLTNIAGAIIWTAARTGVGVLGGDCFLYINSIAAAVTVVPTVTDGGVAVVAGLTLAGYTE